MAEEFVLQTANLSKRYGRKTAIDDISLSVKQGEIYGLTGGNGTGKTTVLRILCGLVAPESGTFSLFGETTPVGLARIRRQIGSIIEGPAVYHDMTAAENLEVQKRYLGLAGQDVIREALHLFELEHTGRQKVGKFSSDMIQRVGLAMAFLGNPSLLLLDEPNIGVDVQDNADLCSILKRCNRERDTTILFTSHNLTNLPGLATRYGVLYQGQMLREFTAEELAEDCRAQKTDAERYYQNMLHIASLQKEVR